MSTLPPPPPYPGYVSTPVFGSVPQRRATAGSDSDPRRDTVGQRARRARLVHAVFGLLLATIIGRAAYVQVLTGGRWRQQAERQHYVVRDVLAPRGSITDMAATPLAVHHERLRVAIAPNELTDREGTIAELRRLGVSADVVRRMRNRDTKWVTVPGRYARAKLLELVGRRGVYLTTTVDRQYTATEATRRLLGRVTPDGRGIEGIERMLDSLLRGTPGAIRLVRDAAGRLAESPDAENRPPVPGAAVELTISEELQEIADHALAAAIDSLGAAGGDVVMLDPWTGELRAVVSRRRTPLVGTPAIQEPYEPGSTVKPFLAAALLDAGVVRLDDVVNTEGGSWTSNGRTFTDTHKADAMTVREVIEQSSNIGIVKLAARLTAPELHRVLRDLGFGQRTGLPYPAEAAGRLRPVRDWTAYSHASLAMGYELSVTPVQLAAAYGAIANGGEVIAPTLVRRVADPDGTWHAWPAAPRRRIMRSATAAAIRATLTGTVETGTATRSRLGTFSLAGKTGTARRNVGGRYTGGYTASFVGLFPADAPQLVVVVKLDDPHTTIYGGTAAAPVMKHMLEALIATRGSAVNRTALAAHQVHRPDSGATGREATPGPERSRVASPGRSEMRMGRDEPVPAEPTPSHPASTATFVVTLGAPVRQVLLPPSRRAVRGGAATLDRPVDPPASHPDVRVPDVLGMTPRDAAAALHAAGLHVLGTRGGWPARVATTAPQPGVIVPHGTGVRLHGP